MMAPPAVVMIAIRMLMDHNGITITIMDDNLRRHRNGARKNPANGRT